MTSLSIVQVANVWLHAGGSPAHLVSAVSVCMAESGGRTDAVSPSADYGLWQINAINLASHALSGGRWTDPNANARAAIAMSGNGTNWAAWCTCWTDPRANCGHGFISAPQAQSPAGRQVPIVAAVLHLGPGVGGAVGAVADDGHVLGGWDAVRGFVGAHGSTRENRLSYAATIIKRM